MQQHQSTKNSTLKRLNVVVWIPADWTGAVCLNAEKPADAEQRGREGGCRPAGGEEGLIYIFIDLQMLNEDMLGMASLKKDRGNHLKKKIL